MLAWLTTIANVADIDLTKAITDKYGAGIAHKLHRVAGILNLQDQMLRGVAVANFNRGFPIRGNDDF